MAPRVLIVDDEPAIVFALCDYFSARGMDVDSADSFETARERLMQQRYGVAIVDMHFSGSSSHDGVAVVEYARKLSHCPRIVVLTAYGTDALKSELRGLGVDAIFRKPQPLQRLADVVLELTDLPPRAPATVASERHHR